MMTVEQIVDEVYERFEQDDSLTLDEYVEEVCWEVGFAAEEAGETDAAEFVAEALIDEVRQKIEDEDLAESDAGWWE